MPEHISNAAESHTQKNTEKRRLASETERAQ